MNTRLSNEIRYLARLSPTVEICGFGILPHDLKPRLFPCTNVAENPADEYRISIADQNAASHLGRILWVYHSHPKAGGPSEADKAGAEESTLVHWVYDIQANHFHEITPVSHRHRPLEGRPFAWGELDCYSLIRDYSRARWGIQMTDYPRDEASGGADIGRLVTQHIADEGFVSVVQTNLLRADDILVFRTNGHAQHFGIFKGNSRVLHHPLNGLSRIDGYSPAWQRRLHSVCRYTGKKGT